MKNKILPIVCGVGIFIVILLVGLALNNLINSAIDNAPATTLKATTPDKHYTKAKYWEISEENNYPSLYPSGILYFQYHVIYFDDYIIAGQQISIFDYWYVTTDYRWAKCHGVFTFKTNGKFFTPIENRLPNKDVTIIEQICR